MTLQQTMTVPYVDLVAQHAAIKDELLEAARRVFEHGQFILGPEVKELEVYWARKCETQYAISVSDGTTAIMLVLKAMGIGPGDEVITVANSFIASVSPIVHVGATPRFADVRDDYNIDPESAAKCINEKTTAIIVVHLTGRPADIDEINRIASKHNLKVIEDAAQAAGSLSRNRPVGGLSHAGCFSLHPLKTAGACGDAGIITTNDDALAESIKKLRNHGFTTRQEDCEMWGYNARLDTMQAAFAMVKLQYLDAWIQRRREIAQHYRDRIARFVRIPEDHPQDFSVYHTFPVVVQRRDELMHHLHENGVDAKIHYAVPVHQLQLCKSLEGASTPLPVTERLAKNILSLPINETLMYEQIQYTCDLIEDFYQQSS